MYLDTSKIGRPSYLPAKLASVGVAFFCKKTEIVPFMLQLLAILEQHAERCVLPSKEGWYKNSMGNIRFAGKETITWERIAEKSVNIIKYYVLY